MPVKQFELAGIGQVTVVKRATSRSIRLSIRSDGQIMVSIPSWASYQSGMRFASSKSEWLISNVATPTMLIDGQAIGKHHHLRLIETKGIIKPRSLVSKTDITIRYPHAMQSTSPEVQSIASQACIRALKAQAEQLLPGRLRELADKHGFEYTAVSFKRLKGRWGSCDNRQRIILNVFLMQLPWNCIDYVLLHELTHTKIMRHGPPFWEHMEPLVPHLRLVRKQMKTFQPVLQSGRQTVQ
jgi:predicted metal-dependent hydrolase